MAGASLADYEQVYQKVHGAGKGVIPASALALSHPAGLRAAEAVAATEEPDKLEKARQTSDLMWRLGSYKTITCDCGTKLRIPPNFKEPAVRCPHCGRSNPVA
jgi:heat shock protein HtpX